MRLRNPWKSADGFREEPFPDDEPDDGDGPRKRDPRDDVRPIREEEPPRPRNELLVREELVSRAPRIPVMRERLRGAKAPGRSVERLSPGVRPNDREVEELRPNAAPLLAVPGREDAVSPARPRLPPRSPPWNRRQFKLLLPEVAPEVSKRLALDPFGDLPRPEAERLEPKVRADVEPLTRPESAWGRPRLADEKGAPDRRDRFPAPRVVRPLVFPNCRQPSAAPELRKASLCAPKALDDALVLALDPLVATLSAD